MEPIQRASTTVVDSKARGRPPAEGRVPASPVVGGAFGGPGAGEEIRDRVTISDQALQALRAVDASAASDAPRSHVVSGRAGRRAGRGERGASDGRVRARRGQAGGVHGGDRVDNAGNAQEADRDGAAHFEPQPTGVGRGASSETPSTTGVATEAAFMGDAPSLASPASSAETSAASASAGLASQAGSTPPDAPSRSADAGAAAPQSAELAQARATAAAARAAAEAPRAVADVPADVALGAGAAGLSVDTLAVGLGAIEAALLQRLQLHRTDPDRGGGGVSAPARSAYAAVASTTQAPAAGGAPARLGSLVLGVRPGSTPEQTASNMRRLRRAALASDRGSAEDRAIADRAQQVEALAEKEIQRRQCTHVDRLA